MKNLLCVLFGHSKTRVQVVLPRDKNIRLIWPKNAVAWRCTRCGHLKIEDMGKAVANMEVPRQ